MTDRRVEPDDETSGGRQAVGAAPETHKQTGLDQSLDVVGAGSAAGGERCILPSIVWPHEAVRRRVKEALQTKWTSSNCECGRSSVVGPLGRFGAPIGGPRDRGLARNYSATMIGKNVRQRAYAGRKSGGVVGGPMDRGWRQECSRSL
jgi:hypothetical protein